MSLQLALRRAPANWRRCISTVPTTHESDVVIVGGGPAGLALASALAHVPHIRESTSITLIEASDLEKVRQWEMAPTEFSNRVSSLTNVSQQFLHNVGAWEHVDQSRTCPIEDIQVWDGISDARITFSGSSLGLPSTSSGVVQMSRMTENLNLQRGLLRFIDAHPTVKLLDKAKVSNISNEGGGWPVLELEDGRTIRARLLVGADGPNSPVRHYAGIGTYGWAYPTKGIVATLQHQGTYHPNTTAFQRFLPTGPIAFLPMSDTVSSMVWSTSHELANTLLATQPGVLQLMINAAFRLPALSMRYLHERILENPGITECQIREEIAFRERSHNVDPYSAYSALAEPYTGVPPLDADMLPPLVTGIQAGTPASFPLRYSHTETYLGEGKGARTVLVGDAAHTIHPLAGQGLNSGLGDVECLARTISNAVLVGADIGSYTALAPYARERYLANHTLMSTVDKLHKLYARQEGPIVWARSVGLEVVNELDALKSALMAQAGGFVSQSPGGKFWDLAATGLEGAGGAAEVLNVVRKAGEGAIQGLTERVFGKTR